MVGEGAFTGLIVTNSLFLSHQAIDEVDIHKLVRICPKLETLVLSGNDYATPRCTAQCAPDRAAKLRKLRTLFFAEGGDIVSKNNVPPCFWYTTLIPSGKLCNVITPIYPLTTFYRFRVNVKRRFFNDPDNWGGMGEGVAYGSSGVSVSLRPTTNVQILCSLTQIKNVDKEHKILITIVALHCPFTNSHNFFDALV